MIAYDCVDDGMRFARRPESWQASPRMTGKGRKQKKKSDLDAATEKLDVSQNESLLGRGEDPNSV